MARNNFPVLGMGTAEPTTPHQTYNGELSPSEGLGSVSREDAAGWQHVGRARRLTLMSKDRL